MQSQHAASTRSSREEAHLSDADNDNAAADSDVASADTQTPPSSRAASAAPQRAGENRKKMIARRTRTAPVVGKRA